VTRYSMYVPLLTPQLAVSSYRYTYALNA
jgi:hypothetical protein